MAKKKDEGQMKQFHAPPPVADINVTPMVDVMLVMLIIFMVITPMLSKGVSVEMVKTRNPIALPAADKSDAVVVAVTRDGNTFLGTTKTEPADMIQKVKDLIATRLDKTVFIKADARAHYEKVVDVIENLRAAGVDQLGLLTEQTTEKLKPGQAPAGGL
ncbi:MAG: biopolymer transporter ExbD [Bryobacteraceae bacterium]|jgi:biopolymer transport protein ExbD/biopolymer transport protein TolR